MHLATVLALWAIWWCSFAALTASPAPRTVRAVVLHLGIQAVMVASFIGAITVFMEPRVMPFWAHLFVLGVATVSLWMYDHRFGIARQARMVRAAACCFAARVRGAGCLVAGACRSRSGTGTGRRP